MNYYDEYWRQQRIKDAMSLIQINGALPEELITRYGEADLPTIRYTVNPSSLTGAITVTIDRDNPPGNARIGRIELIDVDKSE